MERLGFGYDRLRELRPDVVYVSNCGFGHTGPYRPFKSWGPIAQAVSGLTHTSGLAGREPAGWGYSYMDHAGALHHGHRPARRAVPPAPHGRGPVGRPGLHRGRHRPDRPGRARRHGQRPDAARRRRRRLQPQRVAGDGAARHLPVPRATTRGSPSPAATTTTGRALVDVIGEPWAKDAGLRHAAPAGSAPRTPRRRAGRVDVGTRARRRRRRGPRRRRARRARCKRPPERCDGDADNEAWGLWPTVDHAKHGAVRVDGLPVHLSAHRLAHRAGRPGARRRTTSGSTPRCSA